MRSSPAIVVFCDLDETLFEPHRFSVDTAACEAFDRLEREQVPVVFSSTRTRAELEGIHQELGISHPFICENGGASYVPSGYFGFGVAQAGYEVTEFGKAHGDVVRLLHRTASRVNVGIVGFSDMSVADVAVDCEVPLLQARLMKLREYSEQFRIIDGQRDDVDRLLRSLKAAGLEYRSHGRYYHLGARPSAVASQFVRRLYERAFGDIRAITFGDHPGSVPLLRSADLPVVVKGGESARTTRVLADVPAARLSAIDSIAAWADAVLEIADLARTSRSSCSS